VDETAWLFVVPSGFEGHGRRGVANRRTDVKTETNSTSEQSGGSTALSGVEACGLHKRTPYGMTNVSMTQLSIARHYGGCKYQGDSYTYLPHTDELIRNDVLKWNRRQKRAAKTPNDWS
jgi:hypothetical protein